MAVLTNEILKLWKKWLYTTVIIIVLPISLVIIFGFIYRFLFIIQKISTDKKIYSAGEEIKIHWSNRNPLQCQEDFPPIQIFRQEATGWKEVLLNEDELAGIRPCVNGEVLARRIIPSSPHGVCKLSGLDIGRGISKWDSKMMYEYKGSVDSCLEPDTNKIIDGQKESYELKTAPPGKYKIQFGRASTIIEIR